MLEATWTDRQRREAAFYKKYAVRQTPESVDFAPVNGEEQRPWNPYWYVYGLARHRHVSPRQKLLDFGCGVGIAAVRFAHLGYEVEGFDLSQENVNAARILAQRHNLDERCRFRTMLAEQLEYDDESFDLVVGIDILHHVDIPRAVAQVHRVLKPGGVAIFKEHVEVPIVDPVRNTALLRAVVPNATSLEDHITEDERKLTHDDLDLIDTHFHRVEKVRFTLLSRLDRLIPHCGDAMRGRLERVDQRMMRLCPPLARLGGTVVLICEK